MQSDLESIGVALQIEGRQNLLAEDFNSEPLPDENPDDFEYGPVGRNAGPPERTRTVADWDMLIGIAGNTYPRTPGNTEVFWVKDSAVNAYGYVPEADHRALYDEATSALDQETRNERFQEIFANLTVELPANFLSTSPDYIGVRQDINTTDLYNQYGASYYQINRYRNEQTVSGDFVQFSTTPLSSLYLPEQDDNNSAQRTGLLHDGAYAITVDDEVFPYFFDIEDSGDGQVFVCTVRDGIEYGTDADGNSYGQMTAEDWVYQSNMVHGVSDDAASIWNEETPPSSQLGDYDSIENIEQTGELEFQVELPSVDPLFPLRPVLWGESCLPKGLFEQYAPDAQALREAPEIRNFTWYGNTGPYTFEDRTPGDTGSFLASRNEDYYMRNHVDSSNVQTVGEAWADAPYFEQNQYDNEAEQSTVLERFRNGEGDVYGLPTDAVGEFRQAVDDVRVEESLQPFLSMAFFNQRSNGHPLMKTQAGRRAVAGVIDKQVISEQIQRGLTNPAVTYQPEWSQYYDPEAVNEYGVGVERGDIEEAREEVRSLDDFTLEEV